MMTAQAKQREITAGHLQKGIPEVQQLLIGFSWNDQPSAVSCENLEVFAPSID